MKYHLEWVTTDDTLIIRLIATSLTTFLGSIESEIVIPLEALIPQGRARE